MSVFLLSLAFAAIIAIEVPGLVRKKMWKELLVFSVLLAVGMFYSYGLVLDWPLPNPTKGIEYVFKPVSKFMEKLLS